MQLLSYFVYSKIKIILSRRRNDISKRLQDKYMKNSDYKNESFRRSKKIIFYKTVTFGFEKKEEKSLWILVTYKKENAFMNVEYLWFYQIWTCIKITSRWWLQTIYLLFMLFFRKCCNLASKGTHPFWISTWLFTLFTTSLADDRI